MQAQPISTAFVKNLIDNDTHNTKQLIALLEKEKCALEQSDSSTLKTLLPEKQQILQLLEINDRSRRNLLQQLGRPDTPNNWRALVKHLKLASQWQHLEQQLKRCRELNQTVELIISRTQQSVGRILEIYRGQYGQTGVYNEQGNAHAQSSGISRTITTA